MGDKPSIKRLRSVAHSTGHHGMSYFSYLHPHLWELSKSLKVHWVSLDLLNKVIHPTPIRLPRTIKYASAGFRQTFREILGKEGWSPSQLTSAKASFQFATAEYPKACLITLVTSEGKVVRSAVADDGTKAEVLEIGV